MRSDRYNSRLLTWGIWLVTLATVGFMIANTIQKQPYQWLVLMPVYCLAVFALLHSLDFMGVRKALWFLALGLIVPYVAEYLGINFNAVFGGHWYATVRDLGLPFGVILPGYVPLAAVLTWYGMLYVTFVASIFMLKARRSDLSSFATVPMAAGILAALWQVTAGPAMVGRAMMTFSQGGFYHSIPLASFIGWFVTTMFVTLFFQVLEPGAVEYGRFERPDARLAPLAVFMFGAAVLHSTAVCLRLGFNDAGWMGVGVLLLYVVVMVARARSLAARAMPIVVQPTAT